MKNELTIRNLDPRVIDALNKCAARNGRSPEQEHRILLETALLKPEKKTFTEALSSMPNVGINEDSKRMEDQIFCAPEVFD